MTNWFQRQHGWTCRECGAFNSDEDSACRCEVAAADRAQRRRERAGVRWEHRDAILARSDGGQLYRVRRYAGGGRWGGKSGVLMYRVLVPGGYSYVIDRYRAPASVVRQVCEHFFGVNL